MLKELKKFRIDYGLKSKEMAERLGLTRIRYSNIENGKIEPPLKVVLRFQEIFGVDDPLFYFKKYD